MALSGAVILFTSLSAGREGFGVQYASYFVLAVLASQLGVGWRTEQGVVSLNLMFVLVCLLQLSPAGTLLLGACSGFAGAFREAPRATRLERACVEAGTLVAAIACTETLIGLLPGGRAAWNPALQLIAAGGAFFFAHTIPQALAAAKPAGVSSFRHWRGTRLWMLPYYVASAGAAGLFDLTTRQLNWETAVLMLPVLYLLYRSYRLYMGRLEDGMSHARELTELHLRTIEALALAIDAKDHTTGGHLQRVQVYALEVACEMGLPDSEMEALRAASLLHDIGKLAVPEHIISKPGKLTREEFEKMKIHPVVGAEILERVQFPYPVVPIVRSHHEKWDGTGYPDGLEGEAIPAGARILAAVDCLDALASDRQYRKALPLDQAIAVILREAGSAFDPRVVEILARRYVELEGMATARQSEPLQLCTDIRVERGAAPAAGFAAESDQPPIHARRDAPAAFSAAGTLAALADARQDAQALLELVEVAGVSLSLAELFAVLSVRLDRLIPFEAFAVYLRREDLLQPEYTCGEDQRLFASLAIPVGQGLSGWVVESGKPVLNGNPAVEPGYLNDPTKFTTMRSCLAAPLTGLSGVVGAVALYHSAPDRFTREQLRLLETINARLAIAVESSLRADQNGAAVAAFPAALPNSRGLLFHLDAELACARERRQRLAVTVLEVGDFAELNRTLGQAEARRAAQAVAKALKERCGEEEYVARMGAGQFVVVSPGAGDGMLLGRVEQFRGACREALEEVTRRAPEVSLGCAQFPADGADAAELLAEADRRMFEARQALRNERLLRELRWSASWPGSAAIQ
jgi:diguanylate cyclase (GGDEF)-like protein/putative nucleotidyltransferase with HDIG domain